MRNLQKLQAWLDHAGLDGILIPSTDEFISEYCPPSNRRLKWATGFSGSTGLAIVLRRKAALFLDGRYCAQGRAEAGSAIDVVQATPRARRNWLALSLSGGDRIGFDPMLHSVSQVAEWRELADELGLMLLAKEVHPVDELWQSDRPDSHSPAIDDYSVEFAGVGREEKCTSLVEYMRAEGFAALFLADPEDVSWFLNVRAAKVMHTPVGEWHVVPSCTSRVLVEAHGSVTWFVEEDRVSSLGFLDAEGSPVIASANSLIPRLKIAAAKGPIGLDPRRTPDAYAAAVSGIGKLIPTDEDARRRWRKTPAEVKGMRQAHILDAVATVRFMAWLSGAVRRRPIDEFEAAEMLQELRSEHPEYRGASMPLMSASGANGALPHYLPRRSCSARLNDHPLYWIDSGGHYSGGTTDNTITIALAPPAPKHVLAHTLVVQGFIALAKTRFPEGMLGIHLDVIARRFLWQEGMDFGHGTGHGVGNLLNIHEGPYLGRDPGPLTLTAVEADTIITNEPGYYAEGDFGLRIESHMLTVRSAFPGYLQFETISRLPIDPSLIAFDRLDVQERSWLAGYHDMVMRDLCPALDPASAQWLSNFVRPYELIGGHCQS